jgi:Tfp pilus assembly protein FimV
VINREPNFSHQNAMTVDLPLIAYSPTAFHFREPSEPSPPPIKEPPNPPENPDAPVREPDPDEPGQI